MKTAYVALCGLPNSGKSTLINRLVGERVAIVSPKPQTTRKKMIYLCTDKERQLVLFDTPGFFPAEKNQLDKFLISQIDAAITGCELIIFITAADDDSTIPPELTARWKKKPVVCVLNKIDLLGGDSLARRQQELESNGLFRKVVAMSALRDLSLDHLFPALDEFLSETEEYLYDPELISLERERDIVEEFIREELYEKLSDELPYASGVIVEEMKDRENGMVYVKAIIYCEKSGQKAIIIGKNGEMIRKIGGSARVKIEKFTNRKIFLDLQVKNYDNWRKKEFLLKQFGYK
ncbi:MAG: GTPase Era [Candidatus Wallbacteria bacterium]|nr:GTPase Era [Candidatus Wallbacteria bacterium]